MSLSQPSGAGGAGQAVEYKDDDAEEERKRCWMCILVRLLLVLDPNLALAPGPGGLE